MPESEFDPTLENARRKAALQAHLEASHAASTAAEVEGHRAVSGQLRAAHRGMYDMTPQQMAADVAARTARVGDDYGGRDLEALGGTIPWEAYGSGPAPRSADLRPRRPGQRSTGVSSLYQHMHQQ